MNRRRWIVIVLLVCATLMPFAAIGLAVFLEPPAYVLTTSPDPLWRAGHVLPSGAQVRVEELADAQAARTMARRSFEAVPTIRSSTTLGTYRYRTRNGVYGFIAPVGSHVVSIRADSREKVDAALSGLPFLKISEGPLFRLVSQHLPVLVGAILVYVLVMLVASSRLLAWAERKGPLPGRFALSDTQLRRHLEQAAPAGVTVHNRPGAEVVFERASNGRRTELRLRLDARERVVRAVLTHTVSSRRLMNFSIHKSRTMPLAGWSADVGEAVRAGGWTWQPVFTFLPVLGG